MLVLSTYPSAKAAKKCAEEAVQLKMAACVNVVKAGSTYRWKGKLIKEVEWLAVYKTTAARARQLCELINKGHPYEVPEILMLPGKVARDDYFEWLLSSTA